MENSILAPWRRGELLDCNNNNFHTYRIYPRWLSYLIVPRLVHTVVMRWLPFLQRQSDTHLLKFIKVIISTDSFDSTRSRVSAGCVSYGPALLRAGPWALTSLEKELAFLLLLHFSVVKSMGPYLAARNHNRQEMSWERTVCWVPGE